MTHDVTTSSLHAVTSLPGPGVLDTGLCPIPAEKDSYGLQRFATDTKM